MGRLRITEQARRPASSYFPNLREKGEESLILTIIMTTRLNTIAWALLIILLVHGCKKEENPIYIPPGPYDNGAFIANEGTFGQANASVSFYSFSGDSVRNSVYSAVNKHPLGQLLQSLHIFNGKIYMMLNLSDTVKIANASDFKSAGTITGLSSPRYMTSYNVKNKGYITQWGEGGVVKVVDLRNNSVLKTIKVGMGPEQAIVANGYILVCNGGAYDHDSTVSVIDPATDQLLQTVDVGDNPKEMVIDRNNNIWVICYGYIQYDGSFNIIRETPSKLVKLSGSSFLKLGEYVISPTQHPQHIDISKDKSVVYYGGGFGYAGIYAMNIDATATPFMPLIDGSKYFYGFNVNPANGELYACDATDFTSPGVLYRYSPQGSMLGQYSVDVAPNGVLFK
jgi:YVTN family beta-propeller protein